MNENKHLLSDLDSFKSSERQQGSVDAQTVSVLEVDNVSAGMDNNSCTYEMNCSNLSEKKDSSVVSSIDCSQCTVICFETYDELKKRCDLLGLQFVDSSEDKHLRKRILFEASGSTSDDEYLKDGVIGEGHFGEQCKNSIKLEKNAPKLPNGGSIAYPEPSRLRSENLIEGQRVLLLQNGLFYAGCITEYEASQMYGIVLDGKKRNQVDVFTKEELLTKTIVESKALTHELPEGTRVCAYWSTEYKCLYPGVVSKAPRPSADWSEPRIFVLFDDGDSGQIPTKNVRIIPPDIIFDKQAESPLSTTHERKLSVNCLSSTKELINKSQELNITFVDCCSTDKGSEVDLILKDKIEEEQKYYLVKWKCYDLKYSTWEPDYNLSGCRDMIHFYETLQNPENLFNMEILKYFIKQLVSRKPCDNLTLIKIASIVTNTSEDSVIAQKYTQVQLKCIVKEFPHKPHSIPLKKLLNIMRFAEKRKSVLINLKEWEYDINSFNPATYIEVENNVDLEEAPNDFQFIHDYVAEGINMSEEPAVFCKCKDCFESNDKCCPGDSEAQFAYNKFRRLQLLPGYPIYECNKFCKCDKNCINRVVQHGPQIKVAIFRTSNGCGWGLKTLETIQKDQFVVEYIGEILTSDAAEIRGKEYDNIGRSYLFDLDYGEENCQYTVDAGHFGNSSHFINHSCDPNLHVFAVWINNQDPHLPRLAFFAKKRIYRGQELTFDYKMIKTNGRVLGKVPCKCNARKCRRFLC